MAKPKTRAAATPVRSSAPSAQSPRTASSGASSGASWIAPSELEELLEVMARHDAVELEQQKGDQRLVIRRGVAAPSPSLAHVSLGPVVSTHAHPVAHAPAPAAAAPAAAAAKDDDSVQYVTSPLVGTFYRAPSPEAPAFAEVGTRIKKGQRLCIVEAMKLMNEIESEVDGTILEILVENGKPVEYGQKLFKVSR
ncbi:MAG: acetyl-CoA carboxylase biotin carboxyl carrier protein [Myxococcales bacterium]|nr:acetyl-CoA carboxylase biotin carboxyl carrier protein [Myxococcales bacterium]